MGKITQPIPAILSHLFRGDAVANVMSEKAAAITQKRDLSGQKNTGRFNQLDGAVNVTAGRQARLEAAAKSIAGAMESVLPKIDGVHTQQGKAITDHEQTMMLHHQHQKKLETSTQPTVTRPKQTTSKTQEVHGRQSATEEHRHTTNGLLRNVMGGHLELPSLFEARQVAREQETQALKPQAIRLSEEHNQKPTP